MASLEEELRLDEEENLRELAFIREQLPSELKDRYSDDDILYIMDAVVDYYFTSGILESNDDEVDICRGRRCLQEGKGRGCQFLV